MTDLADYFEKKQGFGILATSDTDGAIDIATCAGQHIVDENTIALVLKNQFNQQQQKSDPHAVYMFIEPGKGHPGKRLHLTRIQRQTNKMLMEKLSRTKPAMYPAGENPHKNVVFFEIDDILPLSPSRKQP